MPANIGQPNYRGVYATTGSIGFAPGITFIITADTLGTIGNSITITGDALGSDFATLVGAWNSSNPSNTATLSGNASLSVPSDGVNYPMSGGVNQETIPSTLELSLNTLFVLTNLVPALYKVKICEVDFNDNEFCLEGQEFIDCHSTPCVDAGLCDPTEDVCNVILGNDLWFRLL